jgi:poly-gamma-glutamate synthesis protein (capsule biosynthesis protein)
LLLVSCSNGELSNGYAAAPDQIAESLPTKTFTVNTPTTIPTATPTATLIATKTPGLALIEVDIAVPEDWEAMLRGVLVPEIMQAKLVFCDEAENVYWQGDFVYAIAASFPTVRDNLTSEAIRMVWGGDAEAKPGEMSVILVDSETHAVMSDWLGASDPSNVQIIDKDSILAFLWGHEDSIVIMPFEEIDPRMKVLAVDDLNPFFTTVTNEEYPFTVQYCISGDEDINGSADLIGFTLPSTNRDLSLMTSVLMTGVTALVRDTAYKMETNGILYPAQDVIDWFQMADLAHVSNEVPFYSDCPPAVPARRTSRFCSDPAYLELLTYLGVDLVELTGNHLMDYGREAFAETLDLYEQNDLRYFGAGENLAKAREPLLLVHNGNRIAFLGCLAAGPELAIAEETLAGVNSCDVALMEEQIQALTEDGYLVVVGVQHFESCQFQPTSAQRSDFGRLAQAGATIVSGSQAHCPQVMTFVEDRFIHYGLGNLFFDQMWDLYRDGFLDYHVFYDRRYLGVQLLTTRLEDASRPRPMTVEERSVLLETIFFHSEWGYE